MERREEQKEGKDEGEWTKGRKVTVEYLHAHAHIMIANIRTKEMELGHHIFGNNQCGLPFYFFKAATNTVNMTHSRLVR